MTARVKCERATARVLFRSSMFTQMSKAKRFASSLTASACVWNS